MYRHFKLNGYLLILFTAVILMASCNNGDAGKKVAENAVTDAGKKPVEEKPEQTKSTALTGTLDNLYIETKEFKKLPNAKLVLSFTFRTNDTLTLYGWSCKSPLGNCNGTYNKDPDIKLKKYNTSGVAYGPIVFFGDVVLQKKDVKDIQDKFGGYKYVVFVPENIDGLGFIYYNIHVTNDDPGLVKAFTSVDTQLDANPSPPKGYN